MHFYKDINQEYQLQAQVPVLQNFALLNDVYKVFNGGTNYWEYSVRFSNFTTT